MADEFKNVNYILVNSKKSLWGDKKSIRMIFKNIVKALKSSDVEYLAFVDKQFNRCFKLDDEIKVIIGGVELDGYIYNGCEL